MATASNQNNTATPPIQSPGGLYALNETSGELIWNFPVDTGISYSSPAIADGVVFVGSDGGSIYALNASTGAMMSTFIASRKMVHSPVVAYGVVYVGSDDGKIYAVGTYQGPQLSPTTSPTQTSFPSPSKTPGSSIAEFPTWTILPLILATAILVVVTTVVRRKRIKPDMIPQG